MPKSFRKPKKNPPPPPPLPPSLTSEIEDDLCAPPLLVIHKSPLRNKTKAGDNKSTESDAKSEPKLSDKQQQKISKGQLQKQQKLSKEQTKKSSKTQNGKSNNTSSRKTTKDTPPSPSVKVSMNPKPEDREVEVKYTIRRSISGKSMRNENGEVRMRVTSRSPSSRTSSRASSRLGNYSDTRRKEPLPPRAPLSSGRRSRTTSGSSDCASRQSAALDAEPLQRRHSPEGGEQSPRRGSGLNDASMVRPKDLTKSTMEEGSPEKTSQPKVTSAEDDRNKRLSKASPDTLASPVASPSSYVVMKAYTSPTAKISAGPTLTMSPPPSDQLKELNSTTATTKDSVNKSPNKSPPERPPLKNGLASPPPPNKAPPPPVPPATAVKTFKSPYARPVLNINKTPATTDSKSPYAEPEPVEFSSAGSGLVKPKLISPYARPFITQPDHGDLAAEAVKAKLTSPYQKPTVLISADRLRTPSSLRDEVFESPETPPPPPPDLDATTTTTPSTTPPRQTSPYAKPAPPTRCSTLRPQSAASDLSNCMTMSTGTSTFSRHAGLRSSFIAPPTPIKDRDEYDRKVETIYAIPTDEVPELYSEDTLRAIKGISDKYDTNQRRNLQAMSFRQNSLDRQPPVVVRRVSSSGTLTPPSDQSLTDDVDNLPLPPAPGSLFLGSDDGDASIQGSRVSRVSAVDQPCLVSAETLQRVELFYSSRDSHVCVCRGHARMSSTALTGRHASWRTRYTGVPVWLLTDGSHRRRRQLRLLLAEPGTAFPLWMQTVHDPEAYQPSEGEPGVHTVLSPTDGQTYRLNFADERSAGRFLSYFRKLTSDRQDEVWTPEVDDHDGQHTSAKKHKKRRGGAGGSRGKSKQPKPVKIDSVGQPCAFNHVTRVADIRNGSLLESLSDMIAKTTRAASSRLVRSASALATRPQSAAAAPSVVVRRRPSNASSSVTSRPVSSASTTAGYSGSSGDSCVESLRAQSVV